MSWYYDCSLFTHKEQGKHCREIGLVITTSQGTFIYIYTCLYIFSLLTSIKLGKGTGEQFLACFLNERRFIQPYCPD